MTGRPYKCHFCGQGGILEYDAAEVAALGIDVEWMFEAVTHNRCADFLRMKFKHGETIQWALRCHERRAHNPEQDMEELRTKTWDRLVRATKAYCFAVCQHYRKPLAWEPSIATQILEQPARWKHIMNQYERTKDDTAGKSAGCA